MNRQTAVNPEIMIWARQTAGLTPEVAATKLAIGADRLLALERGEKEPTRPLLVRMARSYHRPLIAFYLTAPPPCGDRGADFRTRTSQHTDATDGLLDALIRAIRARQSMIQAVLTAEAEAASVPFVGSQTIAAGEASALDALRHLLGCELDHTHYYAQRGAQNAFEWLRSRAEQSGVFVLLQGDLGSYHSAIDTEIFRGCAIAADVAPFVVINDRDAPSAWSFTLLHELVHLLLGQTGISGTRVENDVERFCNDVAGAWLLPTRELDQLDFSQKLDLAARQDRIGEFAATRNLSRTMVAYRLLCTQRITRETFNRLYSAFSREWRQARARRQQRASTGGPSYYVVRRHRLGKPLLSFAQRMTASGALTTTKAALILGVKPKSVAALLGVGGSSSMQRANRHIPDVCRDLNVGCCGPFAFTRALNFTTGWRG